MIKQNHIIKKQILDLELSSSIGSFHLQTEIGRIFRDQVIPIIDQCCTHLSNPGQTHRIDKLELDIGHVDINSMQTEFPEKIGTELVSKLQGLIDEINSSKTDAQDLDRINRNYEFVKHFIQTGTLPWWTAGNEKNVESVFDDLITNGRPAVANLITEALKDNNHRKRLILQFSDTILCKIYRLLAPISYKFIFDFWEDIKRIIESNNNETRILQKITLSKFRLEFWLFIMQQASVQRDFNDKQSIIIDTLVNISKQAGVNPDEFLKNISKAAVQLKRSGYEIKTELPEFIYDQRKKVSSNFKYETSKIKKIVTDLLNTFKGTSNESLKNRIQGIFQSVELLAESTQSAKYKNLLIKINLLKTELKILSNKTKNPKQKKAAESLINILKNINHPDKRQDDPYIKVSDEKLDPFLDDKRTLSIGHEEIYVDNAGIILMWPYLKGFFEKVKIVKDNIFISKGAAGRGAYILQYLAHGREDRIQEHLLPLNKVLCGFEIEDVIEAESSITDYEKSESEAMLQAVIKNWGVLKETSTQGLRQAFFLRQGVLKIHDGSWLLQIERQTHDILLNKLPWTINVIKLPWMENVLFVEW